jgi:hypothetical protein
MQAKVLLAEYIEHHDLCPGANTVDEWLDKRWIEIRVGNGSIRAVPLFGLRKALTAHDVHHVLTGYPTSLEGECELAAFELSSGGCGFNLVFWVDRLGALVLGLALHPRATLRALRRGIGARNLYGSNPRDILAADVEVLRERMRLLDYEPTIDSDRRRNT